MELRWSLGRKNGTAQDEVEPKPACSLVSLLVIGRILLLFKCFKCPAGKLHMHSTP
jgi:hypothetical protein